MPTLNWIGKEKVVKHHLDVPFRILEPSYTYGDQEDASQNKIIHGDNLEALKSLLPEYEGKIKCIYIDPPYNTGNKTWIYNDNVNHPKIRKWLGQIVGKEGEDLSRHDKWLSMMYPRIKLLHRLLSEDGVIFVSIDDVELLALEAILDEIFGRSNRVGKIVWRNATDNNPTQISVEHEYIVCYARNKRMQPKEWKSSTIDVKQKLIELADELISKHENEEDLQTEYTQWFRKNKAYIWPFDRYKYIDFGGIYTGSQSVHNPGKEGYRYDVIHPKTEKPCQQPLMGYRFPERTMERLLDEDRVLFGEDENKIIELKLYVQDYRAKLPSVIELDGRKGTNEVKAIFPEKKRPFDFPKSIELIEELLSFVTENNDVVLDSFAGSATTAHSVLNLNGKDRGNRKFILVELEDYADSITAERVKRVIDGYGSNGKEVEGAGGGFTFYELGKQLFLSDGSVNKEVPIDKLKDYIYFTETKKQLPEAHTENPYFLGSENGNSYYLLHEHEKPMFLNYDFLSTLVKKDEAYIIYGDRCLIDEEFMRKHNIIFKKVPRDIVRF